MTKINKMLMLFALSGVLPTMSVQQKIANPGITYSGTPKTYKLAGLTVTGIEGYEDYVLTSVSGLTVGRELEVPGMAITDAVKRYQKHGLFSDVSISADSIMGDDIYLRIYLAPCPRISTIDYNGPKKVEREDMERRLGLLKGGQITPNMIDRAKILAKRYFEDKGYKNAEVFIRQRDDVAVKNQVIFDTDVDKKEKLKVRMTVVDGDNQLGEKKIKGTLFSKGVFAKTHEAGKLSNLLKLKKFTPECWAENKENLITKHNEHEYRDTITLKDSVWNVDPRHVDTYVKVDEGKKYYIRSIKWVGNTVYSTDHLFRLLDMKKGNVYNQTYLNRRLSQDEDAVGNTYWNNGYFFYNLQLTKVSIADDSIDFEARTVEGQQAYINRMKINGNDRLREDVVRRELRTKPGDLFSKEAFQHSTHELASMGHFDPEVINPVPGPNCEDGTVDINYNLEWKSNGQVELSPGWGQTGVIGRAGLKLNSFSMANLLHRNCEYRGIMPIGDGEAPSLSTQTNGTYYQSYDAQHSTNWLGGKHPIQSNVGTPYSEQIDISSNYYNSGYMNNYNNYRYGYGNYNYNSYGNYYDPDKYVKLFSIYAGWGKYLSWPDDYFILSLQLQYQRYMLRSRRYFIMLNGSVNNLNFNIALNRTLTDNQLFPCRGSDFSVSSTITPPWSKQGGKDYANLAKDNNSSTFLQEQQEKYRWIEHRKRKFKARTFIAPTSGQKCFVLVIRVEFGSSGNYNKNKKSPFETYYMGGDGMSGYTTSHAEETIGPRGYENGPFTPRGAEDYAYNHISLELRYPSLLGNTTIYGLGFAEVGSVWTEASRFGPFDMKRSAGLGVRISLPMVGTMDIDWAYGFDKVFGTKGGSQFHFILGWEFQFSR